MHRVGRTAGDSADFRHRTAGNPLPRPEQGGGGQRGVSFGGVSFGTPSPYAARAGLDPSLRGNDGYEGICAFCNRGREPGRDRQSSGQRTILPRKADQDRRAVPCGRAIRRRGAPRHATAVVEVGAKRHHRKSAGCRGTNRREGRGAGKPRWLHAAAGRHQPQRHRAVALSKSEFRAAQRLHRGGPDRTQTPTRWWSTRPCLRKRCRNWCNTRRQTPASSRPGPPSASVHISAWSCFAPGPAPTSPSFRTREPRPRSRIYWADRFRSA